MEFSKNGGGFFYALFAGRNVSTLLLRTFHVLPLAKVRSYQFPSHS